MEKPPMTRFLLLFLCVRKRPCDAFLLRFPLISSIHFLGDVLLVFIFAEREGVMREGERQV